MIKVKRALISVYDKTGIIEFARELSKLGIEIISTEGTFKILSKEGIAVKKISEITGFPEILEGRVKTLHPKIFGAILAKRDSRVHQQDLIKEKISTIDMVVINFYPFEKVISEERLSLEDAIEYIDIGGPSVLRAAAKNYENVVPVSSPEMYSEVISELKKNDGKI
jgi:phosphoribosylaminoimidazolecarboxamide formyltransferase/IMP cyclohydrolase